MPAFSLLQPPPLLPVRLLRLQYAPLPYNAIPRTIPMASVGTFSPVTFSAQECSTSELLRTLSRMAASKPTSWLSSLSHIVSHLDALRDLSRWSGLFPSRLRISSFVVRLPPSLVKAFAVWLGSVGLRPLAHPVLYLLDLSGEASPKAISGRTSYLQARLAYHLYPHLIPHLCNGDGFGPPRGFTHASAWTWVARLVSCLLPATSRSLRTRFPCGSGCPCLNLATESNSLAHSPKGTPSGVPSLRTASPSDCL